MKFKKYTMEVLALRVSMLQDIILKMEYEMCNFMLSPCQRTMMLYDVRLLRLKRDSLKNEIYVNDDGLIYDSSFIQGRFEI